MVQVIGQEGLGDLLGQSLGSGMQSGLQMLMEAKMKGMQKQMELQAFSDHFNKAGRESETITQENQDEIPIQQKKLIKPSRRDPSEKIMMEQMFPGSAAIIDKEEVRQQEEYDNLKSLQNASKIGSKIFDLIKYSGPSLAFESFTNEEVREKRKQLDTLALSFEKEGAKRMGKGTLSQKRFDYLVKRLPSSDKTQASNRGSLAAWNEELGLEIPELMQETVSEESETLKTPQGTVQEEVKTTVFDKLPSAVDYKERIIVDKETGKKYRSDGKKWKVLKDGI